LLGWELYEAEPQVDPGVKLVPAHTMALGLAQEHACTYEQIG
jgi:hypothetical protein